MENLKKRIEIENLKGLHHTAIFESENESDSGETPDFVDKAMFEKLDRNFKRTDFYFGNNEDSLAKHSAFSFNNKEFMGE